MPIPAVLPLKGFAPIRETESDAIIDPVKNHAGKYGVGDPRHVAHHYAEQIYLDCPIGNEMNTGEKETSYQHSLSHILPLFFQNLLKVSAKQDLFGKGC